MKLLDLPVEIVAQVLQHTLVSVGFGRAFGLRLVCKRFDAEVLRASFATRVTQDFPRDIQSHRGVISIVSRYLESRSLADSNNSNQLIAAIRRAAETLAVGIGMHTQHTWRKNIGSLCKAATIYCHPETIYCLLDLKENRSCAWNNNESMTSIMKIQDEMDVFVGAAYTGNIAKVREMLASGCDAQRGSGFFRSPLQCACSGGHKDIVLLLLEHGADVNHGKSYWGDLCSETYYPERFGTPLQSACLQGHEDIVREPRYKLSKSEYHIAALQAARGGHSNLVMLLLGKAAPETIQREYPLSEASKYGQKDFVHMVLNKKAFRMPDHRFF